MRKRSQAARGDRTVTDPRQPGGWDATGVLLERYAEVEAGARRLSYLSGFGT